MSQREQGKSPATVGRPGFDPGRPGLEATQPLPTIFVPVRTQHGEGVTVLGGANQLDGGGVNHRGLTVLSECAVAAAAQKLSLSSATAAPRKAGDSRASIT